MILIGPTQPTPTVGDSVTPGSSKTVENLTPTSINPTLTDGGGPDRTPVDNSGSVGNGSNTGAVVGAVLGLLFAMMLIVVFSVVLLLLVLKKKKSNVKKKENEDSEVAAPIENPVYSGIHGVGDLCCLEN